MHSTQRWVCLAAVVLPILVAASPVRADDEVRVTVVAILASDRHNKVHPKLKEVAQEVQKREPGLTGFTLAWTSCRSVKVGEKEIFKLVEDQVAEVTAVRGPDKDDRVSLRVKAPMVGEISYITCCDKFFPILTRYQTTDKKKPQERLIVAVMVRPCGEK